MTRAILNRDPTEEEIEANGEPDAAAPARALSESGEFASLLPGIRSGAYFWGKNRTDAYTGSRVMTAREVNALLGEGKTVTLPRGNSFALYLGNWCEGRGALRARIASEDPETCTGDFQPGFEELGIGGRSGCFITNAYFENGEAQTLKEAILHEAPVTVPAERFLAGKR